jgi:hypothetical protein
MGSLTLKLNNEKQSHVCSSYDGQAVWSSSILKGVCCLLLLPPEMINSNQVSDQTELRATSPLRMPLFY